MTTGTFEDIEFVDVHCYLCGETDTVPAGQVSSFGANFSYKLCRSCGLKFMSPRPSEAWYAAHYNRQFWEYKQANRSWRETRRKWRIFDFFKRGKSGRMRRQRKRLDILVPLIRDIAALPDKARVLDIGCAYGAIGRGLREALGCEVWGVEPNETARKVASEENGIRIFAETAETLGDKSPPEGGFDLILMSNVLENILDPASILKALPGLMGKKGKLCIHTPDFYYYDCMNPYHPYIYSAETLSRLLADAGFRVVATERAKTASERDWKTVPARAADRFVTVFAVAAPAKPAKRPALNAVAIIKEQEMTISTFKEHLSADSGA